MEQGGGRQLDVLKYLLAAAMAAIGIGLLRMSRRERRDMRLVERSGEIASPRDGQRVAVCGRIEANGEPFQSPVRGKPAVLYHFTVYHLESRPNSDAQSEVVDFSGYGATPVSVAGMPLGGYPILHDFHVTGIVSDEARDRMTEHLRFARLEPKKRGQIEWVHLPDPEMWDGRTRVERDFTLGQHRSMEKCRFNETVVAPGEQVCAIGIWSAERNALVAAKGQDLWLYRGTKATVREILSTSVGCGRVLGILLIAGAIALAAYFAGLF